MVEASQRWFPLERSRCLTPLHSGILNLDSLFLHFLNLDSLLFHVAVQGREGLLRFDAIHDRGQTIDTTIHEKRRIESHTTIHEKRRIESHTTIHEKRRIESRHADATRALKLQWKHPLRQCTCTHRGGPRRPSPAAAAMRRAAAYMVTPCHFQS